MIVTDDGIISIVSHIIVLIIKIIFNNFQGLVYFENVNSKDEDLIPICGFLLGLIFDRGDSVRKDAIKLDDFKV